MSVEVVVTGLGATTPLGGDVASTWDAMLAGKSGVSSLTQDWAAQLTVLRASGYDGPIGLEYFPTVPSEQSVQRIKAIAAEA